MALADAIIAAESGGGPTARNPRSSATGAGQFIDRTWMEMIGRNRPYLMQGRSPEEVLALRNDPTLSREMTAAYAKSNADVLSGAGLPVTPATSYLAHFAGPQGAIKLLTSDPSAPAGAVLGESVVRANPFLRGMTVGDLSKWAAGKVSGTANAPQTQPAPTAGPIAQAPPAMSGGAASNPVAAPQEPAQPSAPMAFAPPTQPSGPAIGPVDTGVAMPLTGLAKARLLAALTRSTLQG